MQTQITDNLTRSEQSDIDALQTQITANYNTEQTDKSALQTQITNNYNTEQTDKSTLQT